ncbi:FkbM family methyltransferase [Ichthyenterobacterium sp. W332]|uniref:FkbM family methyltransferase n=1 Tax=Microcosmobacter mediterraneus TaxID=3075607 RepID=A0ABU2YLX0_9FLAO|nr:FkbM family methyltransferase [Ichthyenterobacterium sp. W332]MDT0558058.1 FkbM family methyltransferase [Ichthyenterobacterium sp. W332]
MKNFLKRTLHPKYFFYLRERFRKRFDEIPIINEFLDFNKGVMFDVGSCNGSSFMPFLLKGWDIYAFEPDKGNNKRISDYLNKWKLKANLIEKAVSDVEETKTFYTSTSSAGIPSLLKFNENQVVSHELSTIMLKNFVKAENLKQIDFLKIDIEGYDLMALKGFDFSDFMPRILMCEFEDKKTKLLGYSTKEMAQFLKDKGYFLVYSIWFPIKEYGIQHDWKKMSTDINEINSKDWGNIIGFANEKDFNNFRQKHKI